MPIQNGTVTANIGRDCQVVIQGPRGNLAITNAMDFDAKQSVTSIEKTLLDGRPINAKIPRTWSGSFSVERGNSALDDEIVIAESAWRATGLLTNYTIFQYISEASGTTSTYQYDGVQIDFDSGSWKGDSTVTQKVMFTANTRKKL